MSVTASSAVNGFQYMAERHSYIALGVALPLPEGRWQNDREYPSLSILNGGCSRNA